jgi:hypothetical protein
MQRPPTIELMLPSVNQVVNKIEDDEVEKKTDPSDVRDAWPNGIDVESWETVNAQHAKHIFNGIFKCEKHHQLEQAQTMNERVYKIDFDPCSIGDGFDGSPFLQRRNENHQNQNLKQAKQEPPCALKRHI